MRITTDGKNFIDIDIKKQYQISYTLKGKKVKIVKSGLGLNSYITTLRGTVDKIEIAEVEITDKKKQETNKTEPSDNNNSKN